MTTYLFLLGLFATSVYVYGLRILQRFRFRNYPGPKPAWLLGGVKSFRTIGQPKSYQEWGKTYGPGLHVVHLASVPTLSVTDPEIARKLLYGGRRPNFSWGSVMSKAVRDQTKHSILLVSGQRWKTLRSAWQPMFFTGSLEGYLGIMDKSARLLVTELGWASDKDFVNVQPMVQDLSLNVIGQTAFGLDLHSQKADQKEISKLDLERSNRLRESLSNFFLSPASSIWVISARLFPFLVPIIRIMVPLLPDAPLTRFIQARKEVESTVQALVEGHQNNLQRDAECDGARPSSQNAAAGSAAGTEGPIQGDTQLRKGVAPGSFIDLLVRTKDRETGQPLDNSCIINQALTMMLAGYETTASALTFTIYLLSQGCNASKQMKLVEEIDGLGRDWRLTFEALEQDLPYMDAIIKESLRVYSPAFMTLRAAEEDLKIDGHNVKKGTWITIPNHALHHDSRIWGSDADQFLPERWLSTDPAALKKAKNGFFAFGDGPRVCPGQRFATTEIKLALLRIFQEFKLELGPDQEPLAIRDSVTISAKHGVYVRPIARKR